MMNIMMAGNEKVYFGIELAIYSTMFHNKNVHWYIVSMDYNQIQEEYGIVMPFRQLDQWQKEKLVKIVKYFDPINSSITFIDAAEEYEKYLKGGANEVNNFTPYAALRLLADILFPDLEHILYFDCDVAVTANIEGIYQNCLNNPDEFCFGTYAEDANEGRGEMVSGVMLFKLDEIRKNGFLRLARMYYRHKIYQYPDQHALQASGRIGHLPIQYGYLYLLDRQDYLPPIIHFTNELKKIYDGDWDPLRFYRRYSCLQWVQKGLQKLDIIAQDEEE